MEAVALLYPQLQSCINIGVAGSLDVQRLPLFSSIIASSLVEHDLDTSAIGDPKGLVSGINLVSLPVDEAISLRLVTAAESVGQHPLRGVISSGDTFYADPLNKERIHQEFHSLATDMEAAPMPICGFLSSKVKISEISFPMSALTRPCRFAIISSPPSRSLR